MNKGGVFFLVALILVAVNPTEAQQPKKMARIGYLSPQSGPTATLVAFKEGLRELGWVEGKQVKFEYRYAGRQRDKLSDFATELVHLKVDVIVAGPGVAAMAAKHATTTIPIVINRCKSNCYFVVAGVVSSYGEENKEEAG